MNIQEFTASVISQIIEGIKDAQSKYCESLHILPPIVNPANLDDNHCGNYSGVLRKATDINFKILVNVSETTSSEKGGGVNIRVVSWGNDKTNDTQNQISNSVSFTIPIIFPAIKGDKVNFPTKDELGLL